MVPTLNEDAPLILVDDNDDELFIAQSCYDRSRLAGPFIGLHSGGELLQYLDAVAEGRSKMPGVVLMDIRMPMMSGFETLELIRQRPEFRELPIVLMLTNSDDPRDEERSRELGANGFQRKPADVDDFIRYFDSFAGDSD